MYSKTSLPPTGSLLTFIGSAHTALGCAIWITGREQGDSAFWFTAFGVAAAGFGVAVGEVERSRGYVPAPILGVMAALTAFGLAFQPVSGFITVLAPLATGVRGWMRRRHTAQALAG